MGIGKKRFVSIVVYIEAISNLDEATLEKRLGNLIDPSHLREQVLDREFISFLSTTFSVRLGPISREKVPELLPLVEPASDAMKLQRIKELVDEVKGKYGRPDDLEQAVFKAFEGIARVVL
jgi:hypothetical protein